jgi:choline dehydrogenase
MRRVLFEAVGDIKATGIEVSDVLGNIATISLEQYSGEVVLACGSIGTPQCLMLSGIGPRDELNIHKIPLLVNLDGVGRNLMDHGVCPVIVRYFFIPIIFGN